jgi:hypothetical protein
MKLSSRGVVLIAGVLAYINLTNSGLAETILLPDPSTSEVVLVFDISQTGSLSAIPLLKIFANGKTVTRAVTQGAEPHKGSLAPDELMEIIKYVVGTQDIFSIDSNEITKQIKQIGARDGRLFLVADAPTTFVSVTLKDKSHSVSLYAVDFAAMLFQGIESLQRLKKINSHLLETAETLRGD